MAQLNLADFNKKVQLGDVKTLTNEYTGAGYDGFVPKINVWFASKTRSLSQSYQLQGTLLENSRTIIIRHNSSVEELKVAVIDNVQYDIVNYSPDETSNIIRYDYLTLKRSS
ncbi:head-tail joining protein [Lactococcus cremoris subsp. cremoris TIFN6]|uniref:Head-tail joining protein n=1 Tax=Lactococcus cremoris subsp. cremoris TIFN6 TaxID=1234876 RepID=T0SAN7_LACLC|nr:head-tail joining protein [Lactococcus cremoris subsp. cremoris TIFN6]